MPQEIVRKKFFIASRKHEEQNDLLSLLFAFAAVLKSPLYYSLALLNSNYIKKKYSIFNPLLGSIGIMASILPWLIGSMLRHYALTLENKAIKYYKSPYFKTIEDNGSIGIGTYNIASLPDFICHDSRLKYARERIAGIIQTIRDAAPHVHFVCVQEAFCLQEQIRDGLSDLYSDFLLSVAPDAYFLDDSGLMLISKFPIIEGQYIRPPLPFITPVDGDDDFSEFFIEGLTNKGILMAVVKVGDHYDLVINAHLKSEASADPDKQRKIEALRTQALTIIMRETLKYKAQLSARGINIRNTYFGADVNASPDEDIGLSFDQRKKNRVFFEGFFPNKDMPATWAGGEDGYHQEHKDKVKYDHLSVHPPTHAMQTFVTPHKHGHCSDHLYAYMKVIGKNTTENQETTSWSEHSSPSGSNVKRGYIDMSNINLSL